MGRRPPPLSETPACSLDYCDRPVRSLGYCKPHYQQSYRGEALRPLRLVRRGAGDQPCFIDGCGRPIIARGFCNLHYKRSVDGTLDAQPKTRNWTDWSSPHFVSSSGAHARVRALWGKASQYPCIECGQGAAEWAYDGTDETERYGENAGVFSFYSLYPEFYMPMCHKCHRKRDSALAQAELREYREWKHRTGLTLADVSIK